MDKCNFLFIQSLVSIKVAFHSSVRRDCALLEVQINELVLYLIVTLDFGIAASALTLLPHLGGVGGRFGCVTRKSVLDLHLCTAVDSDSVILRPVRQSATR